MAKLSSPWIGYASGKLGEGVYYQSRGRQMARARNRAPRNPRTRGQLISRMVLSNSSRYVSQMRKFLDHSIENVANGTDSLLRARSLASDALRRAALRYVQGSGVTEEIAADFTMRASVGGFPVAAGLPVSFGSLPPLPAVPMLEDSNELVHFSFPNIPSDSYGATYGNANPEVIWRAMGCEAGDQLSLLMILSDRSQVIGQATVDGREEQDFAKKVLWGGVRLTSLDDEPVDDDTPFFDSSAFGSPLGASARAAGSDFTVNFKWVPGAGEEPEFGSVELLVGAATEADYRALVGSFDTMEAFAIVRSHIAQDGTKQFTRSQLIAYQANLDFNNAWPKWLTFGERQGFSVSDNDLLDNVATQG